MLATWALLALVAVGVLVWGGRERNHALPSLLTWVWRLVVLYSGPFGLAVSWYAGRTQSSRDSLWRRGLRSTARCYSGSGAGEVVGILVAQAILGLAVGWVAAITVALAYLFGDALTVGPLPQAGVPMREATLALSLGFLAAFPVNLALVRVGVEEGMQNPAEMG